jgi:hypothetical protein
VAVPVSRELTWDYEVIATVLLWKYARKGLVVRLKDLGSLPFDRVLNEYRAEDGTHIRLSFVPIEEAEKLRNAIPVATGQKVGVSEMQGRWQKMATVALWKLKRDKPVVLTEADRLAVPHDRLLLIEGFKDDVLLHFVNKFQARKMLEKDTLVEKIQ